MESRLLFTTFLGSQRTAFWSYLLVGIVIPLAVKEVRSHPVASRLPRCLRTGLLMPSLRNRKRGLLFSSTYPGGKIAEEDDMLKRTFSGTLAAAALGVAASGGSIPDFAQNLPARCLPQETRTDALNDGCSGFVRFGMSGLMVVPGQAPDVEATGSVTRSVNDDAEAGDDTSSPE
jgi:hypothetical protein